MKIQPYKNGDEEQILELFQLSFGQKMSKAYWEWRFQKKPFLEKDVNSIFLMWDNEKLVGHYAVSPIELQIEGKTHKTALSMTTMTHPEYGGKGIFTTLANALYEYLEEEKGYSLIWGFPNNNSHYGFLKRLKWQDIITLPMYSVQGDIVEKYGSSKNITINSTVQILEKNNDSTIKINKTEEFYNWRFNTNPSAQYFQAIDSDTKNSVIYKVYATSNGNQIDILEKNIHTKEPLEFLNLLKAIANKEKQVAQFNLWLNYYHRDIIFYEKSGFRLQSNNTYFSCRPTILKDVLDFKKWDIDFLYSDIY